MNIIVTSCFLCSPDAAYFIVVIIETSFNCVGLTRYKEQVQLP